MVQFGGIEQETPTVDCEEAQMVPPEVQVHGLGPDEQSTILEVVPLMSIVDSELIIVAEVAVSRM